MMRLRTRLRPRSGSATRIKICGLTTLDDARCAAEAGADYLGFIFYEPSPRFVAPPQAAAIIAAIRAEWGPAAPRFVGVFVDEPVGRVQAVLDEAGLDLAQLHGDEPPAEVARLAPRAFKALRPPSAAAAEAALAIYGDVLPGAASTSGAAGMPQLLIDAFHPQQYGGTGTPADLAAARLLARRCRLLLAGGLDPDTVGPAIEAVRPWGVDVSSGVERAKGVKDHDRLRALVRAVRAADLGQPGAGRMNGE
jgi:phosphoribosylanthranilate isomerase